MGQRAMGTVGGGGVGGVIVHCYVVLYDLVFQEDWVGHQIMGYTWQTRKI